MPPFDDEDLPPPTAPPEPISILTWALLGAAIVLAFCTAVMLLRPLG